MNASKCEEVTCNKLFSNLTDLKQNISSCSSCECQSIKTLEANIQILNETKCPQETCTIMSSKLSNIGESVKSALETLEHKCDDTTCKMIEMRIAEVGDNVCHKSKCQTLENMIMTKCDKVCASL